MRPNLNLEAVTRQADPDMLLHSVSARTYVISDMKVLNELDYPVWISTYQPGDTRFLWANETALKLWKAPTLEAFVCTDLISKRQLALSATHDELFNYVQARATIGMGFLFSDFWFIPLGPHANCSLSENLVSWRNSRYFRPDIQADQTSRIRWR